MKSETAPKSNELRINKLLRRIVTNTLRKLRFIKAYAFQKMLIIIQRQKLVAFHLHDSKLLESLSNGNKKSIAKGKLMETVEEYDTKQQNNIVQTKILTRIYTKLETRNTFILHKYIIKWKEHLLNCNIYYLISQINAFNATVTDALHKENAIKEQLIKIKDTPKQKQGKH